jgi:putative membrane protein insertion efficiency factor
VTEYRDAGHIKNEKPVGHASPASLASVWRVARRVPVLLAILWIRSYQIIIRPHLIGCCRFHPTCSEYAIEALSTHGLIRGSFLAIRRLVRCHPFSSGGIDPVPQ